MLKITREILKKLVKFRVVRSIPGRIRLKSSAPQSIIKQVEEYDKYIRRAICLLPGIEDVEVNYTIGTVLIEYDLDKTYEKRVLNWIQKIIDVGLDNADMIKEYSMENMSYVEGTLEKQLKEEVKKL